MLDLLLTLQQAQPVPIAQQYRQKAEPLEAMLTRFLTNKGYSWRSLPEEAIVTPFEERSPSRQTPGLWYRAAQNGIIHYLMFSTPGTAGLELSTGERLTGNVIVQTFQFELFSRMVKSSNVYVINPQSTTDGLGSIHLQTGTAIHQLADEFIQNLQQKNIYFEPVNTPFTEMLRQ
jgi:hypothetical protein